MARKPLTEEQKEALRQRLAKAREAKQAKTNTPQQNEEVQTSPFNDPDIATAGAVTGDPAATISVSDYEQLKAQIEELKSGQFAQILQALGQANQAPGQLEQPTVRGGTIVGSIEKHDTNLESYPNPKDRLASEPKLSRFAFHENYDLKWQPTVTSYQTIDKVWYKEPRFYIELHSLLRDEFTGMLTGERIIVTRLFMHEDEEAALAIARDEGIELPDPSERKLFMDELRYIRVRDWLLEAFYPKRPTPQNLAKERVINGRLVQVIGSSEAGDGINIDWSKVAKTKI